MISKLPKHFFFVIVFLIIISCKQKNELPIDKESSNSAVLKQEKVPDVNQFESVNSVIVGGKTISLGMLADDLFAVINGRKIFTDEEHIGKDVIKDPNNSNSLLVTHHYKTEDKLIDIFMSRPADPGPYRIKEILVKKIDTKEVTEKPKTLVFKNVKKVNVAGFLLKVGQDAYVPQGRLESYFVKNEGDILSTHDSHYSVEGKIIIITYGPSSDGPYIVTGIKISEEK
ncbi:MAG: hypothetical protein WBQ32_05235 [Ignavibacteriaceae bacterium]